MKRFWILFAIVLGFGGGFFVGKINLPQQEAVLKNPAALIEAKKKCSISDQKAKLYFKKYGTQKNTQEPINNQEWLEAQSWEQACTEALEELRSQLKTDNKE